MRLLMVITLLIVTAFSDGYAQTLDDKIYFGYGIWPRAELRDQPGASEVTSAYELQIGAPPIPLGARLKWINTVYGRLTQYNFSGLPPALRHAPADLVDLQYGAILIYDFAHPKWSMLAAPRLIMRSDENHIFDRSSLFFGGILLVNYNPDGEDRLVWSAGLALANDFNRNVLIPIVGLTFKNHRFNIEVTYPRVNVLYKPIRKIEWGATAGIAGGIYGTNRSDAMPGQDWSYTRTIDVQTGQTFNYLISEKWVFNTFIGYSIVRNYDPMSGDFKPIRSIDADLKPGLFVRTGLSIRF